LNLYCVKYIYYIKLGGIKLSKYDELQNYKKLLDQGILTQQEYEEQKRIIINSTYTVNMGNPYYNIAANDAPSTGMAVLGFFFPLVGFIVYGTSHIQSPLKARSTLRGAITGIITWVTLSVLAAVLPFIIWGWF